MAQGVSGGNFVYLMIRFCEERQQWVQGPVGNEKGLGDFKPNHWRIVSPPIDTALL